MSKRGGYPMGAMPGGMTNMLKQAQRMQRRMEEQQEKLAATEFTGTAGGGVVSVVCMGDKTVKSLSIKPEAVDPEDVEMLEDTIVAALNDAFSQIDEAAEGLMG